MNHVITKNKDIYLIGQEDFEPKHIFENGQMFRWTVKDDEYTIVVDKYVSKIKKLNLDEIKNLSQQHDLDLDSESSVVRLQNAGDINDYHQFWHHYFDMDRDYAALRKEFSAIDDYLKKATEFSVGLRVLNQDFWEMVISFIISANNNISRIKNSVSKLSELAGEKLAEIDGVTHYKFPTAKALAQLTPDELSKFAGVGYRAPYIIESAKMIDEGQVNLDQIRTMPYEDAHKEIMRLPGVGPKVADCILLFGDAREIAFPVDTWVIKVMNEYYLGKEKNNKKIKAYGLEYFGQKAGLAQQYLFYHARATNVGAKKK